MENTEVGNRVREYKVYVINMVMIRKGLFAKLTLKEAWSK